MISEPIDGPRERAARVFHLLARGRYGVEADVGEEDERGSGDRAREPLGEEGRVVGRADRGHPQHDEERQNGDLDQDHDGVRASALLHAQHEHRGDGEHEEHGRHVHDAALLARRGYGRRQLRAEHLAHEHVQVAAPPHRDGGHRDGVLEDQVPADDPRHELAERGVAVGAHRDHRGELRKGQGRERAGEPCEDEGEDDRRAGVADGLADDHEDPGADDAAEAERREVGHAHGPPQLGLLALRLADEALDRLAGEDPRVLCARHGSGSSLEGHERRHPTGSRGRTPASGA
jgi:hypothetical protein